MTFSNRNVAFSNIVCYAFSMIEFYETTESLSDKKRADMEAVLFGQEDCAPSHGYGPTMRPYHLFHFVTAGRGRVEIGGAVFELGAGDAFLIPAEQVAYYEASATEPWSYSWAGLTGLRAEQYVRRVLETAPEHYVLRGLMWEKYAAPINRAARLRGTNAANHFRATQVLYELFSYLAADLPGFDDVSRAPSLAAELKFYLDAKYMEKLRMEHLAERFGVHPNHLSRVFRAAYHMAPKQYLQRLKLEKAARMLASSDVSVALVAESLGFEDQHAFSRAFKKYWGVSPTDHRRSDTAEFHQS